MQEAKDEGLPYVPPREILKVGQQIMNAPKLNAGVSEKHLDEASQMLMNIQNEINYSQA
jgi:hypothetical protein